MQFPGKLTQEDLKDVSKLNRPKMYWAKFALRSWYAILLLVLMLLATVSGLLGLSHPNWRGIGIVWLVLMGLIAFVVLRARSAMARNFQQVNAALPDQIELTNEGVKWTGPNGATGFMPWRNFKGWREGQRVVLVDEAQAKRFFMLPVGQLPTMAREPLRQFLRSHISGASR